MRRANVKINVWVFAGGSAIFLLVASLGYFLFVRSGDPFGKLEKLDVISYSESAKAFQGGVFLVEGTMEEVLHTKTGQGKLVSIVISTSRGAILIPILIPESFNSFNLQKGQGLKLKVIGIERGLLKADKIEKAS